ncbi:Sec31 [Spironucleus salmonicida]|uniref:Sec31 n=1 Tax=Spironucleus salmonicida TaxID=348837 RepID=V6LNM4_9EUKA|nr:Sec31 [Spironucleus salmonicida]|eukprot:EST45321.1 Sec31 [Spironucleus salmonicida]
MFKIDIDGSVKFSPNNETFIVAEHGTMNEDFVVTSSVELFKIELEQISKVKLISIPGSLKFIDWSDNDSVALAAENGQIFFTDSTLSTQHQVEVCDGEITAISYSQPHPQTLLGIGTQKGEVLFFEGDKLLYSTKNKSGENPHRSEITSISWNTRVPRVCVSSDQGGNIIVWDQKKKGAIGNFQTNQNIIWAGFSTVVATCVVCVSVQRQIILWDMRVKGDANCVYQIQCQKQIIKVDFLEGYEDNLSIKYVDGSQAVFKITNGEKIELLGELQSGATEMSLFYPNIGALIKPQEIVIKFIFQHAKDLKPVVYNPFILTELPEDEPETYDFNQYSITEEQGNQVIYIRGCPNLKQFKYIKDMQEIVTLVQDCIDSNIDLPDLSQYFINHLSKNQEELLDLYKLPVPKTERIDIKQVAKVKNAKSDLDFFNEDEANNSSTPINDLDEHKYCQQVLDFLYNGDIRSAINYLANNNELSTAFYLALSCKIDTQEIQNIFREQNCQWNKVFNIVDIVKTPNSLDVNQFDTQNWQQYVVLIEQYDNKKLQSFIQRVLNENTLLTQQQSIDLNIIINNRQTAYNLIQNQQELNFTQSLQFDIISQQNGIIVDSSKYLQIIDLLLQQNEAGLASILKTKLNIQGQEQVNISKPVQQQRDKQIQPTFAPSLQFIQPQYGEQQKIQQSSQLQFPQLSNSVQRIPPPILPQQTASSSFPQSLLPPPAQNFNPPQQQNNIIFATDLLQQDTFQPQVSTFQPQQTIAPTQTQLMPPQVFNPQQSSYQQPTGTGPSLNAPPPPSITGMQSGQMLSIPTTTAPKYEQKQTAIQSIDLAFTPQTNFDNINTNGSDLAAKIVRLSLQFQQKEPLSFNKHWTKLADCAIWVSDNELKPLLSDLAVGVLGAYFDLLEQGKGGDAQKVIQSMLRDHSRDYEESISRWAGAFRFMSNAFK